MACIWLVIAFSCQWSVRVGLSSREPPTSL
jgi:hypothetical protein